MDPDDPDEDDPAGGPDEAGAEEAERAAEVENAESAEATFPYWALTLPPAAAMFAALAAAPLPGPGAAVLTRAYPRDHRACDGLSNLFTERARIVARAGGGATPLEAWAALAPGPPGLSPEALRELVYARARECGTFNPVLARWVVAATAGAGARVLDPSAGWGDRLLGALAAGAACYHGFDPNPRLRAGLRAIVAELGGGRHGAYRVATLPFEEADAAEGWYDLALTSPPYFSFEVYVDPRDPESAGQSAARYADYGSWVARMYAPYLAGMYRAVRPGGWVVVYVEDVAVDGVRYPLRRLTGEVLARLGAAKARDFGLRVAGAAGGPRPPRVRWALGWRKPAQK